jgi:hypothetical protein
MAPTINLLVRGVNRTPALLLWLLAGGPSVVCERLCHRSSADRMGGVNGPSRAACLRLVGRSVGERAGLMVTRIDRLAAASAPCRTWCAKCRPCLAPGDPTPDHAGATLGQYFLDIRQAHAAGSGGTRLPVRAAEPAPSREIAPVAGAGSSLPGANRGAAPLRSPARRFCAQILLDRAVTQEGTDRLFGDRHRLRYPNFPTSASNSVQHFDPSLSFHVA